MTSAPKVNRKLPYVVFLGIFWGLNFPVSKFAVSHFDPYSLRLLTCLISLFPYLYLSLPILRDISNLSWREVYRLCLLAVPLFVVVPLFNLIALNYLDSSTAVILIYTMPAIRSLIHIFKSRRFSLVHFIPMTFCVSGCLFIILGNKLISLGHGIILLGAIIWAMGGYFFDEEKISVDPRMGAFIQLIFAAIVNILIVLIFAGIGNTLPMPKLSFDLVLSLFYIGIMGNGIAFIIWYRLMINFGSRYAAYSMMTAPPIGVIASMLINDEHIHMYVYIGLFLMIASMVTNHRFTQRHK